MEDAFFFTLFLVFSGAALIATLALFTRQSLLVAYIALGVVLGPSALGLVPEPEVLRQFSHVGVVFLLFLLGLNLHPQKLLRMLHHALFVTLVSSVLFGCLGTGIALLFGFSWMEALVMGAAAIFSSTIVGLKLLPATALHHRHTGEVIISVLLLQDLLAIVLLLLVQAAGGEEAFWPGLLQLLLAVPLLSLIAWAGERFLLLPLFLRFDSIREFLFLGALGWCLGVAQLGAVLGLSLNVGAFIGGVALARNPVATYIAESLRPLRDFFLILFFFALGADLDLKGAVQVVAPALVAALLFIVLKPVIFHRLLRAVSEAEPLAREVGWRLGQLSEFSLLMAVLAFDTGLIGKEASIAIQLTTLITFIASSYLVVARYPTPIAASTHLRQD